MGNDEDPRFVLQRLTDLIGPIFGTEDFSIFLYAFIRMQRPKNIVELGTGLGTSAFWMALAAKSNGVGRVTTVDDLSMFSEHPHLLAEINVFLQNEGLITHPYADGAEYFTEMSSRLGLEESLNFVSKSMQLRENGHFADYPFCDAPIDLLFSDFRHGVRDIVALLGAFLPSMSPSSSIFIDSAPSEWPSYLLLENLVGHLSAGRVPLALEECCEVSLAEIVSRSKFQLVHLTETKERNQNATAWLKIEPIDVFPHPRTAMRGAS